MTPTEIRSVECPYCGAKPGEHCLTMNGNLTGKFGTRVNHYRREVAALRHSPRLAPNVPNVGCPSCNATYMMILTDHGWECRGCRWRPRSTATIPTRQEA